MKVRNALFMSTLLVASSVAIAQGAGGGGAGGGQGGPAGNDPNSGTSQSTREGGDMQASGSMMHSKPMKKHHMKSNKSGNDSTGMQGTDGNTNTQGQ